MFSPANREVRFIDNHQVSKVGRGPTLCHNTLWVDMDPQGICINTQYFAVDFIRILLFNFSCRLQTHVIVIKMEEFPR